jgi:hypothetical protein
MSLVKFSDNPLTMDCIVRILKSFKEDELFRWNLPFFLRSFAISFLLTQKLGVGKNHHFITHRIILRLFKSLRLPMQYLKASTKMCSMMPAYDMQVVAHRYLKKKYILSKDIWILLQVCWIGIMVAGNDFTEDYISLNGLLRRWDSPDHPLIHGMKMIVWLESGFSNSACVQPPPTPSNIRKIISKREKDGKPCSFFHDICKGMIHLFFSQKEEANECFKIAKSLLMLEDPINVKLYMVYLNKMITNDC